MTAAVRARRELTGAVLLSAAAGGLALSASGQPWADVTITRRPPLPPTEAVVTGSQAAPLVAAAGLLLLAAALAVIAVRGMGRLVVGLLVVAAGGVLGWAGLRGVTGQLELDAGDVSSGIGLSGADVTTDALVSWPALTLVAGVLGVLAGLLVVLRGRSWPGMGRRYERPGQGRVGEARPGRPAAVATPARAARPETDEDRHQAAWKALDRGDDPTV